MTDVPTPERIRVDAAIYEVEADMERDFGVAGNIDLAERYERTAAVLRAMADYVESDGMRVESPKR